MFEESDEDGAKELSRLRALEGMKIYKLLLTQQQPKFYFSY